MTSNFTKRDTTILKGFAILCIVFHNYFHWLSPSPGENEFNFLSSRVSTFFHLLGENPGEWFNLLFSYLGHYGVQIFVVVSGFGLTVSMINKPRTWESFVVYRLKKLYLLLLTGVLVYYLGVVLMESSFPGVYVTHELKHKLIFIHTLIPNSGLSVIGPWWFFALILQLYLLFPLLFHWFKKQGWKAFGVVCLISYALVFLFRYVLNHFNGSIVMMNAPGHLPEFCLGIMLALQQDRKIGWGWLVAAIVVFCLGNVYAPFYPFTFISIALITLFAYQGLKRLPIKKHWISRPLAYFGGISMTLFVVHGSFRTPVLNLAQKMPGAWGHFFSGMIYLLVVWAVAVAAKVFYDFLCRQVDKIHIHEGRITHVIGRICQVALGLFFIYILSFFVVQNLHKNTQQVTEIQLTETDEFTLDMATIATIEPDRNWLSFDVKCSFDFSSMDTTAPMPKVVLDIPSSLWLSFVIPESYNTTSPQRYEFTYHYDRPFNVNVKGKKLRLYLLNSNEKGPFKFENAQVTILR